MVKIPINPINSLESSICNFNCVQLVSKCIVPVFASRGNEQRRAARGWGHNVIDGANANQHGQKQNDRPCTNSPSIISLETFDLRAMTA